MSAILKRKVLYLKVRFISPISVSSGIDEWTDSDVLRDCDDKPFISGSSIAGAMRAYLEKEKTEPCLMMIDILRKFLYQKNEMNALKLLTILPMMRMI